jgi:hypothetical protein
MRPTSKDAYIRLMVLKCVVGHSLTTPRQEIPELFQNWPKQEQEHFDNTLKKEAEAKAKKMEEFGLWQYTSPKEKEFLLTYGSRMDEYAQIAASWRMECIGMLMWALGLLDIWPKY